MSINEDEYSARRREYFLKFVNKDDVGLEIGPSYRPVFPKSKGFNCKNLDHLDRPALIDKYRAELANHPNLLEAIEEVDYVWQGQSYSELVNGRFNYVVACHVLEHQEDFLGFLHDTARILKPGLTNQSAYLLLALPEKRKTFDCSRPLSTIGDIFVASKFKEAFRLKSKIDEILYMSRVRGKNTWFKNVSELELLPSEVTHHSGTVKSILAKALSETEVSYEDRHRWIFTQNSFFSITQLLSNYGLIPFELVEITEGLNEEFYAVLKLKIEQTSERLILLERELLDDLVRSSLEFSKTYPDL